MRPSRRQDCVLDSGACRTYYNYLGNDSGGWKEERWSKDDFLRKGWTIARGLDLVPWNGNKEEIAVFTKVLPQGAKLRLRCNKYGPPHLLTF